MTDGPKPVLWVSLTSEGRHGSREPVQTMQELQDTLEDAVGEDYQVVVADDRVRLLDAEQVRELLQNLQEKANEFAHEDALFSAATEGDSEE